MKSPTNWYHIVGICLTLAGAMWAFGSSMTDRVARLEEKVNHTSAQYEVISRKIDEVQLDIRQILVTMQNKQDRK